MVNRWGRKDNWVMGGIQLMGWCLTGGVLAKVRAGLASVVGIGGGRSEGRQSRKNGRCGREWSTSHGWRRG